MGFGGSFASGASQNFSVLVCSWGRLWNCVLSLETPREELPAPKFSSRTWSSPGNPWRVPRSSGQLHLLPLRGQILAPALFPSSIPAGSHGILGWKRGQRSSPALPRPALTMSQVPHPSGLEILAGMAIPALPWAARKSFRWILARSEHGPELLVPHRVPSPAQCPFSINTLEFGTVLCQNPGMKNFPSQGKAP